MTGIGKSRLFLDSNVLMGGFSVEWGLNKAVLSLCASSICKLVLAEAVRLEVERNLARHGKQTFSVDPERPLRAYYKFLALSNPEIVSLPQRSLIESNRNLIRHAADLPVLLSAMTAQPDWLLTNNTKHFTREVAMKTGLRIGTPVEFFRSVTTVVR